MDQMLGILMLDTHFPRIKGDVGNPDSFSYPVRKLTVRGASPDRVVREADPSLLEPFLQAAEQLEREGCAAITTSCGFSSSLINKSNTSWYRNRSTVCS